MSLFSTTAFCTIITNDYLHYALALRESLLSFNKQVKFYILVTDKDQELKEAVEKIYEGTVVLFSDDLCSDGIGQKIYYKYFNNHKDEFRWSMKPVLLKHLITELNFIKVFYLDCDLFFFNSYDFLFEKLDVSDVILTPHWRSMDPHRDFINFQILYDSGLYNGGFVAVNHNAVESMDWWAMACEYVCVKLPEKGYYVDQTHLNLFPVMFDKVEILKHRGCNVANWNQVECKRVLKNNGEVLINDQYPVVFIHFTESTVSGILKGEDALLRPYLEKYAAVLKKYNPEFDIIEKYNRVIADAEKSKMNESVMNRFKKWIYAGR
jgi:lipopolysaccharide biosynthesis glycosyltransferase